MLYPVQFYLLVGEVMQGLLEKEQLANIKSVSRIYCQLPEFDGAVAAGTYQAEILGPAWLKLIAKLSLPFAGLPGWCGKRIDSEGAVNLCHERGQVQERVTMLKSIQSSWLDGGTCMVLSYDRSAPFLLRPMRDEFRRIDESTLLGLSIYNVPGIKRIPLPFLLRKVENLAQLQKLKDA